MARMARTTTAPSPLPEKIGNLLQESRWLGVGAVALFLIMALWGFNREDPGWSHAVVSSTLHNPTGRAGAWIADLLLYLFGLSAWWWIVLFGMFVWWGVRKFNAPDEHKQHPLFVALGGFLFLLLASSSLEALRFYTMEAELPLAPGGLLGIELGRLLATQLGYTGSTLFLLALMATGWSIFSGMSWLWAFEKLGLLLEAFAGFFYGRVDAWRDRQIGKEVAQQREVVVEEEKRRVELHEPIVIETPPPEVPVSKKAEQRVEREKQAMLFPEAIIGGQLPPLHLLDPAPPATETVSAETLEYTSRLIERKLADFGVQVKVLAAMPGPVITRYEIEPAVGVKGAQIVNLARDLARALAMVSIRVVETVPGKSCMALELPNPKRQMVKLSEIISSKPYNDMSSPLTVCLGKDIGGQPVVADLAKTPHLLVAGTTGSGKSVGVNAMILSMLYKSEPDHVRLIMVDPKMLELSIYEGIPHLLAPVVTDMKQAANALHWCVTEMEKRYKLMSAMGVRNIAGLNTKIKDAEKKGEHIPNPLTLTPETPEP
ncbi:MAG: DNA translocase FtsK 4TM domain-containing protein, partial [Azonexus sp.]|nr:DNA translocase FtsK 4TM domain-containing protein [Azonexus sp.]